MTGCSMSEVRSIATTRFARGGSSAISSPGVESNWSRATVLIVSPTDGSISTVIDRSRRTLLPTERCCY